MSTRRKTLSLRARLTLGAGLIAGLAVMAAMLLIYGTAESARRVDEAVAAQHRMELLSLLSARVGDYAMIAAEATKPGSRSRGDQVALLEPRAGIVNEAFARLDKAFGDSVRDAEAQSEPEQMRRATRGLGLARMRAQFDRLTRTLAEQDGIDETRLRAALDGFATQFSPLLDQAIAAERRDRDAGFASAERFREKLRWAAWAVAALALILLALFQFGLVRPLIRRIGRITQTAKAIGGGVPGARLDVDRRDELGLLFANVNRLSARIDRRSERVDADRAALNAIIDSRTEELKSANAKLEAADSQRRRFFADVSHELRTPLTVILGEADLGMRASDPDEAQSREAMARIHTRAKRLNRRIDDLLRVARSESGEIELAAAPFDAAATVADAVADLEALAKRRKLSLVIRSDPDTMAIGDADWTRQVVSGLIDNAIRHSPEGSQINVSAHCDGGQVVLSVRDEGEGIAPDEQPSVFERFARGHGSETPGFGVGLSLAKWIVERQSGTIALRSPVGGNAKAPGSEFTIRLPRFMEDTADDA